MGKPKLIGEEKLHQYEKMIEKELIFFDNNSRSSFHRYRD